MTIRWRLGIFALQMMVIFGISLAATGRPWLSTTWFGALVAYATNGQLVEPFYSRPVDVLANGMVVLILIILADKTMAGPGWIALGAIVLVAVFASAIALLAGARRTEGPFVPLARATRVISGAFTATALYSALFWLGLLEASRGIAGPFWTLASAWAGVVLLGAFNWQAIWLVARKREAPLAPAGMIGPSKLLVTGPDIPARGATIGLTGGGVSSEGTVLSRVRRMGDVWAEILVENPGVIERLLAASALTVAKPTSSAGTVLGLVEAGSSHDQLVFSPTKPLRIGKIVSVASSEGDVLYQVARADVVDVQVRGGGNLDVRVRAMQVGLFDSAAARLRRYRWVPEPGAPVREAPPISVAPLNRFHLGELVGTDIPVFLDCDLLQEGHLAILGMTKMGKTTLARRLAVRLSGECCVVVMDQTGEYRSKAGLEEYSASTHDHSAGLSVCEPPAATIIPDYGLQRLQHFANKGYEEYKNGVPFRRVVIVDEAHQFVPEPAGMSFNTPGRESAVKFGVYAMQIRKYGITLVLISQRTAVVAKSALSQCENVIAFKSVDQTGLEYLEAVAGSSARDMLPALGVGEALVCGPAMSTDSPVAVKLATA